LYRLRKVLGEDALASDGEVVSLNAAAVQCDVTRFEALVREGSRDALRAAADLYRGQFIDDVTVGEEGWNEWLTRERERLLELALGAMMRLGEQELAAGGAEHALKAGQRAIALNSMREDAHRLIVQALAATGRKAEALKHYQNLVALLMRDLIASFHKVIDDVVSRFDGFVAQYLGDGVLVYFGYPAADEHDTEQAVRAGLAILGAVRTLKAGSDVTLQARVGIATGLVVV